MSTNNKSKLRKDFESSLTFGTVLTSALVLLDHIQNSSNLTEMAIKTAVVLPLTTGLMTGYKQFVERNEPGPDGPQ